MTVCIIHQKNIEKIDIIDEKIYDNWLILA